MAFCSLEEAWGQDYKSFLSPASLSPDWLEKKSKKSTVPAKCDNNNKVPSGFNTEHERRYHIVEPFQGEHSQHNNHREKRIFSNNSKSLPSPPNEDLDLLIDHDEFNIPYHVEYPEPVEPGLDDYYKLIDSQYDMDTVHSYHHPHSANDDYTEELQYNELYSKACHSAIPFPMKIKKHLKKCKHCRSRMKQWLEELGEIATNTITTGTASEIPRNVNKNVIEPAKNTVKSLVPAQFRGYIDLIFFIALGIFLIFVLDTFVRLGKSFTKLTRGRR